MMKRFFKRPYKDKDTNSTSSRDSLEIKDLLDDSVSSVNGDDFGYLTLHKSHSTDKAPDVVQTGGDQPSTVEADPGLGCVPCLNIATEKIHDAKRKELNSLLKKYKKKENLVAQKQKEVLMMETEVRELMRLCKILEDQASALEDDVQNKKCEMNAFGSLVAGDAEAEVKKREPLYYKKYNNVKNANEAKHLLSIIRHKANAMRHLEIMTYQKLLDFQYQLKSEAVKQKTLLVKKDLSKRRNFEFVFDAIRSRFERQTVMDPVSEDQTADKELETTNPFSFIQSNETNSRSSSPITVAAQGFVLHPLESSL
ncbi:hypothetical protein ACJMK2_017922 [Sinanodonta woodiana]|uniref:Uncharacterized protein n=1 Tax=Sinanodonta woodiana TaxID=1069815 RepID=A0ABD3UFG0_SINWO